MEFFAHHGCFAEERIIGTKFVVDVAFLCDTEHAAANDDISQTVNYQKVYSIVSEEMKVPSAILENVAYRIIRKLKDVFPQISAPEVTVSKLNPALEGKTAAASVTMSDI